MFYVIIYNIVVVINFLIAQDFYYYPIMNCKNFGGILEFLNLMYPNFHFSSIFFLVKKIIISFPPEKF